MAKKNSDTVKIKKGSTEKTVPKAQWEAMKKTDTYGWMAASDLPKDVTDKDAQIELSKIAEFEAQVKTLTSDSEAKDAKIAELEKSLEASKAPAKKK